MMKLNKRLINAGKRWMAKNLYSHQLFHHGVKGQKWGIRNGPPYPLEKSHKNSIIEEAMSSGKVKKTINPEKQKKHCKSYNLKGRSCLDGDLDFAQMLVDELSGTGEPVLDRNGNWTNRERVVYKKKVGVNVDDSTLKETRTDKLMIVYSNTGTHIYPRKEKNNETD